MVIWSRDGNILGNSDSRVLVQSKVTQKMSTMHVYESSVVFNPLSNSETGGDDGNYMCLVKVKDEKFIAGITTNATKVIEVEGQSKQLPMIIMYLNSCPSFLYYPDLDPPLVGIVTGGNSTAGETYYLECSVETVEGVRPGDISISWTTPKGRNVGGENLTTRGNVTRGKLNFTPLTTSDNGEYTCTGKITAKSVGVDINDTYSITVNVSSKFLSHLSSQSTLP